MVRKQISDQFVLGWLNSLMNATTKGPEFDEICEVIADSILLKNHQAILDLLNRIASRTGVPVDSPPYVKAKTALEEAIAEIKRDARNDRI